MYIEKKSLSFQYVTYNFIILYEKYSYFRLFYDEYLIQSGFFKFAFKLADFDKCFIEFRNVIAFEHSL